MSEREDPPCFRAPGCENGYHGDPCPYAPVRIAPDPARDARVAARRAEDARKAGRALDRLSMRALEGLYDAGWRDGYAASELHHNRHYGAPCPRPATVTDESAVHVPHLHEYDSAPCLKIGCHELDSGEYCTWCGGQPCRVRTAVE